MGRVRSKKSFEDVYGANLEANLQKAVNQGLTNVRQNRGNSGASTFPQNGAKQINNVGVGKTMVSTNLIPIVETGRHKTQRQTQDVKSVPLSHVGKDDKLTNPCQKPKREKESQKSKTHRNEIVYDNQEFYSEGMMNDFRQPQQNLPDQHCHHHHRREQKANDDDEDAEEFFEMIKQTVMNAVGKTITELLGCNLLQINDKLDCFTAELKATQSMLSKLQSEVSKQIVHYGEESGRHFRYLCMKSEYDKMFYQHQSIVSSTQPSNSVIAQNQLSQPNQMSTQMTSQVPTLFIPQISVPNMQHMPLQTPNLNCNTAKFEMCGDGNMKIPCTCRNLPNSNPPNEPISNKVSSTNSEIPSNQSSEAGIREVLGQIQRFCNQLQATDKPKPITKKEQQRQKRSFRVEEATIINKEVFAEEEDDECLSSSDNLSPRSLDQMTKYESKTIKESVRL